MITPPRRGAPINDDKGIPSLRMAEWMEAVSNAIATLDGTAPTSTGDGALEAAQSAQQLATAAAVAATNAAAAANTAQTLADELERRADFEVDFDIN